MEQERQETKGMRLRLLWPFAATGMTNDDVMSAVDELLYAAKAAGRNQVMAGPQDASTAG